MSPTKSMVRYLKFISTLGLGYWKKSIKRRWKRNLFYKEYPSKEKKNLLLFIKVKS